MSTVTAVSLPEELAARIVRHPFPQSTLVADIPAAVAEMSDLLSCLRRWYLENGVVAFIAEEEARFAATFVHDCISCGNRCDCTYNAEDCEFCTLCLHGAGRVNSSTVGSSLKNAPPEGNGVTDSTPEKSGSAGLIPATPNRLHRPADAALVQQLQFSADVLDGAAGICWAAAESSPQGSGRSKYENAARLIGDTSSTNRTIAAALRQSAERAIGVDDVLALVRVAYNSPSYQPLRAQIACDEQRLRFEIASLLGSALSAESTKTEIDPVLNAEGGR